MEKLTTHLTDVIGNTNKFLVLQSDVYIASGIVEDAEIPTTIPELEALFNPTTGKATPIGHLAKDAGQIKSKQSIFSEGIRMEVPLPSYTIEGDVEIVTFDENVLAFCESEQLRQKVTILVKPLSYDNVFLALSGVTVTTELAVPFNKDTGAKIKFNFKAMVPKLSNCIKLKTGLA